VPSYTGYTLVGRSTDTIFNDSNNGIGLTIGIEYCYLITAVYADSSESCASPQSCASLKKDAPGITNADVRFTDPVNGSIFVGWSKPTELDTIQFTPPYEYRVYRSPGFFGANFTASPIVVFNDLNDTAYVDTLIDTKTQPWSYKIELWYLDSSDMTVKFKGQTAVASSIFLTVSPTDNALNLSWEEHVPWNNTRFVVYKQNAALTFDSIASVTDHFYSDTGLVNGTQHCYYIKSVGSYFFSGFVDPILNRSQIECGTPVDNVHPCSPELTVNSDCDNSTNELIWTNPNNSCADDVLKYYIFFGSSEDSNYELIDSVLNPTDTVYLHKDLAMISGCYKVLAIDSVGNETLDPVVVCVDTCRQYVLPSVFSPDGDGMNDLFHPCDSTTNADLQKKNCPPYKNVKEIDMKIFNRWGNLVYETKDKNVNWDGKFKSTGKDCAEGVYFYTCRVNFFSVKMEQSVELRGTIQLMRK
jgi:gliding motility-associated-like protein